MTQIQNDQKQTVDYYSNKSRVWVDFLIGFFGPIIVYYVFFRIVDAIVSLLIYSTRLDLASYLNYVYPLGYLVLFISLIFFIVWAIRAERKYVIRGVLMLIIAPLVVIGILYGWCFLAMRNF